ncbi:hypothetical protein PMIN02_012973 [Paraphaeosphaeria minitans]|uniref:Uncharacterized protein n=1 Tax=Paraphaeosphaeria minitans TaxID=565426 RepID=A0A9P6KWQ2_9PLEO|nr:hypothetical protein PMIN01_00743 [Paraphaeosphaeria minitans]
MFPKSIMHHFWNALVSIGCVSTPGLPNYAPHQSATFVPFPKVYTLAWTEPASTSNGKTDFPPSDKEAIDICAPQANPALYKSALDIVRLSNDYFVKSGCRSSLDNGCPKSEQVTELALQFSEEFKAHEYPLPPDLRMLWVTDKDYHPSDRAIPWSNRLWVIACENFDHLTKAEKQTLRTRVEAEQQKSYAASFSDVLDYNDFLVDMFMTYLAHLELAKREGSNNQQPTNAELDAFFNECVRNNGITLYDLHRTFPYVQDIQCFLRRVEYFAVFQPNPNVPFASTEVPEGAYFRKPVPSTEQIMKALHEPMTLPQLFDSLAEIYPEYAHGVGSQEYVLHHLIEFAAPDITTRKFIPTTTALPNEVEIWEALDNGPLSIADLAACFPNRITSMVDFIAAVEDSEMAYRENPMDPHSRWIHMFLDEDDMPISEEQSRRVFALQRMALEQPLKVLEWTQRVATWDGQGFVDDTSELDDISSDTERDTELDTEPEDEPKAEEQPRIEPKAVTPPASPKRKRDVVDDGEEVRTSPPKVRVIKKARSTKGDLERCAYPLQD